QYSSASLHLHSFATRRSSDLPAAHRDEAEAGVRGVFGPGRAAAGRAAAGRAAEGRAAVRPAPEAAAVVADLELEVAPRQRRRPRSEEHTSELQSRENLVCRLL